LGKFKSISCIAQYGVGLSVFFNESCQLKKEHWGLEQKKKNYAISTDYASSTGPFLKGISKIFQNHFNNIFSISFCGCIFIVLHSNYLKFFLLSLFLGAYYINFLGNLLPRG
jgi:hypothetical protein